MFRLIARLTTNRPLFVVLAMAIVMAVALSFSAGLSDRLSSTGFTTRGAESEKALDQLAKATGADADAQVVALVDFNKPIDSKRGRRLVATVTKKLKAEPNMKFVNSPFDDGGVDKSLIANDGKAAVVLGNLKNGLGDASGAADRLQNAFANVDHVTLGGSEMAKNKVSATIRSDLKRAELMAFPLILLIALFVFRGLIAALLPVLIGGITIPVSFALIRMFDNITDLSVFALNLTTGMGLGLAIDYSLLMVTRFREELATGLDKREAVRRTVGTAGRTVAYSAMTVAGATSALGIFPLKFLYSMGIGGATVALVSASVALILLPALLMLLGDKIDRFGIPRRSAEHSIALWRRMATRVMVHPWPVIATTTTVLVLLALPAGGIRFTSVDASVLKGGAGPRVVDHAVKNDFPRNDANSSLWVVVASNRYDAVKVSRDAKRVNRRATRVKRDSAAVKRDAKKLRLAMLAPGANPAALQRRAAHVKRETAQVKRTARRVARQSARVKRSADRLDRYEQRIKRYAKRVAQVANVEQTGKLEVSGKHTWQFDVYTRDSRYAQRTQDAVKDIRTL
ncbi:MAG: MMPL family transporter, partial [Thermoleophilia bacterium]|nr:MMPL family transporter [Thermoleophilia bacterium]